MWFETPVCKPHVSCCVLGVCSRVREQTRVDGPPRRCTTSAGAVFRTWRVAARRLLRTRLIYAPTQDQAPVPSCSVARAVASSTQPEKFQVQTLERLRLRSMSQMPSVNGVRLWTTWPSQRSVPPFRSSEAESDGSRTHPGPSLQETRASFNSTSS